MHHFYYSPGRFYYIRHAFLFKSMVIMATDIQVTPNHFEIVFKFSSANFHRFFSLCGRFLVPSLKLCYFLLL
jgi:hypothetical protein